MENQDIKKDIPVQETEITSEASFSSDTKTENPYSKQFPNPEIAKKVDEQAKAYTKEHPNIEKDLLKYLEKDPEKTKKINTQLNNPALDEAKKAKIINAIIDASIKEAQVF